VDISQEWRIECGFRQPVRLTDQLIKVRYYNINIIKILFSLYFKLISKTLKAYSNISYITFIYFKLKACLLDLIALLLVTRL
jgi:hypothetical protein